MTEARELRVVLCTFPDQEQARQIGTVLVEKQLAACVNLLPGVESIYRWEGKVETAGEVLAVFKTTREGFAAFSEELENLHPYEVPEILALSPAEASAAYAKWVTNSILTGRQPLPPTTPESPLAPPD